mgnify:CR=1 FL=1
MHMVRPVHNTKCIWTDVRRAMHNKTGKVKKSLHPPRHSEVLMCCVAVMEKGLQKKGQVPVNNKEDKNGHKRQIKI